MESFEFLGGRYNRPEQIMSGPVQAFRAQNAANGSNVFIHRVSTTESPAEQAALLKLLTTALVKSRDAKRLVLDFGEESGYWYVVTESEPQCALLREWLQLEIEAASAHSQPPVARPKPPIVNVPSVTSAEQPDPGEFTAFLNSRTSSNTHPVVRSVSESQPVAAKPPVPKEHAAGEFTRMFEDAKPKTPAPVMPPAPPPAPPSRPNPGEFTSFFNSSAERQQGKVQAVKSAPYQQPKTSELPFRAPDFPPASGPVKPDAGEFTQFFNSALPQSKPKQAPPTLPTANYERTQNSPHVQRPNKLADRNELSSLFFRPDPAAKSPSASAPDSFQSPPARSDPYGFVKSPESQHEDVQNNLFSDKIELPKPIPSAQSQAGEFTRMFGREAVEALPAKPPSAVAAPRDKPLLDEQFVAKPQPKEDPMRATQSYAIPSREQPQETGPSEFTRVIQGGQSQVKPVPSGGALSSPLAASSSPLFDVNVAPINPVSSLPSLNPPNPAASVNSPLGSANIGGRLPGAQMPSADLKLPAPSTGGNKQMMIFFIVIAILAVLLVLAFLFFMKQQ